MLGHIPHTPGVIQRIQAGATAGNAADTPYLNPVSAAPVELPAEGFRTPIHVLPHAEAVISYLARRYRVPLIQPLRHGANGIWLTAGVLPLPPPGGKPVPTVPGLLLGTSTHARGPVRTIQAGASAHNPNYLYYLNPAQVIWKNLPLYGFKQAIRITQITLTVTENGHHFDVRLRQPAVVGPGGIWLVDEIRRARA